MRLRTRRRAVAAFVAASILSTTVATIVLATNFGGPKDSGVHCDTSISSQCVGANGVHTVCFVNGTAAHNAAIRNKIGHYDAMSFLVVDELAAPCTGGMDVHVKDSNVPGTLAIAWTKCKSGAWYGGSETPLPGTRWCMPQEVVWNLASDHLINSETNKQMVACHELGHTLGLRHRSVGASSCMVKSTISPVYVNPWTNTDAHDRAHLQDRYE